MKALILKYKSVVTFILTFLLVYGVLTFAYKLYLDYSDGSVYYPDYFTHLVAKQTDAILLGFGYDSQMLKHPDEPSMKVIINGTYVARIIEGCNAISVIILFVSFIVAFAGKLKTTLIYALLGSVLIYVVNLFRVAILSVGLYRYPWRTDEMHSVVFPLVIYGMVFLLWMFWINRFSNIRRADG